jgi:hypothetical protein
VSTIVDEIKRIGIIKVHYKKKTVVKPAEDGGGTIEVITEEREGFEIGSKYEHPFYYVDGAPSETRPNYQAPSLLKLLQAYVALGGNPLDISLFLQPDIAFYVEGSEKIQSQPYGGYISVKSGFSGEDMSGFSEAGLSTILKHPYNRLKKKDPSPGHHVARISQAREWANKEITAKRNRIEENIIKLCDLREQLFMELFDTLKTSLWGTFSGSDPNLNFLGEPLTVTSDLLDIQEEHLFYIISQIDKITFNTAKVDGVTCIDPNSIKVTIEDAPRTRIYPDLPEEKNTAY